LFRFFSPAVFYVQILVTKFGRITVKLAIIVLDPCPHQRLWIPEQKFVHLTFMPFDMEYFVLQNYQSELIAYYNLHKWADLGAIVL